MVNCKNCGAPLSLEEAFCSHCGTANKEAQEHLKKLAELNKEYHKTRFEVVNEVKKSKKGYGLLTILAVLLLMNLLFIMFLPSTFSIAERIVAQRDSQEQVKQQLNTYIANRQYAEFVTLFDRHDYNYRAYREYNRYYFLANNFEKVKEYVTDYYFGKDLYADALVLSCQYIKEFKDDLDRYTIRHYDEDNAFMNEILQMNEDMDLFLKEFLHLNDEDISSIKELSESELLVLLSERLTNEQKVD